jgi:hypothetical protein
MTIRTETKEATVTVTDNNKEKSNTKPTAEDAAASNSNVEEDEEPTPRDTEVSPAETACVGRTTTNKLLKVDRAYNWGPGTLIYDGGKALFEVALQEFVGVNGAGAVYEALIIEAETGEPVVYIRKGGEYIRKAYHIFTAYPNYSGQPTTCHGQGTDFYVLGTLRQSVCLLRTMSTNAAYGDSSPRRL